MLRKSATKRNTSDGAERVDVYSATYDANKPKAKVSNATTDAVMDSGLSEVVQQETALAFGMAVDGCATKPQ